MEEGTLELCLEGCAGVYGNKDAGRACQAGKPNVEAMGGKTIWPLLEIPNILVPLRVRGQREQAVKDEESVGSASLTPGGCFSESIMAMW